MTTETDTDAIARNAEANARDLELTPREQELLGVELSERQKAMLAAIDALSSDAGPEAMMTAAAHIHPDALTGELLDALEIRAAHGKAEAKRMYEQTAEDMRVCKIAKRDPEFAAGRAVLGDALARLAQAGDPEARRLHAELADPSRVFTNHVTELAMEWHPDFSIKNHAISWLKAPEDLDLLDVDEVYDAAMHRAVDEYLQCHDADEVKAAVWERMTAEEQHQIEIQSHCAH